MAQARKDITTNDDFSKKIGQLVAHDHLFANLKQNVSNKFAHIFESFGLDFDMDNRNEDRNQDWQIIAIPLFGLVTVDVISDDDDSDSVDSDDSGRGGGIGQNLKGEMDWGIGLEDIDLHGTKAAGERAERGRVVIESVTESVTEECEATTNPILALVLRKKCSHLASFCSARRSRFVTGRKCLVRFGPNYA